MYFKDIIGLDEAKRHLIEEVTEGRPPHALLIHGPRGTGKLALATAYARYLNCKHPQAEDACGKCENCRLFDKLNYPDLHFVYPVIKKKSSGEVTSSDYVEEWREQMSRTAYFDLDDWLEDIGAANQQPMIYVKESDEIIRTMAYKGMMGGYKVVIIWLPERMNEGCANKILKILEEPPVETVFLLVSDEPDKLLPTILSRTQRLRVSGLSQTEIADALTSRYGISSDEAMMAAHNARGSWMRAVRSLREDSSRREYFENFKKLMRLAWLRDVRQLLEWSEEAASWGREEQKSFLAYCQNMVRENFILNFNRPQMNYLGREEHQFSVNFAPFINERNVMDISEQLSEAQYHIERNVNPKMVFFDMSLKFIVLMLR